MHPNPIYRQADDAENLAFAREAGFGTIAVNDAEGPLLSHVPFVLNAAGDRVFAHLVRSNPIARVAGKPIQAVLSVVGPHGYISPDWYDLDDQVPTWNYVAVHLRGELTVVEDEKLVPHLIELSARFEAELQPKIPWRIDKMSDEALAKMLRMIVPVELSIISVSGTWKLNQNKPADAVKGAAEGVRQSPVGIAQDELANLMLAAISTEGAS